MYFPSIFWGFQHHPRWLFGISAINFFLFDVLQGPSRTELDGNSAKGLCQPESFFPGKDGGFGENEKFAKTSRNLGGFFC